MSLLRLSTRSLSYSQLPQLPSNHRTHAILKRNEPTQPQLTHRQRHPLFLTEEKTGGGGAGGGGAAAFASAGNAGAAGFPVPVAAGRGPGPQEDEDGVCYGDDFAARRTPSPLNDASNLLASISSFSICAARVWSRSSEICC